MEMQELMEHVRLLAQHIGAKSVYGEPVVSGDTTVIPVASVAFGFGGGFGKGDRDSQHGQGGGGGVGFRGMPAGYIEIKPAGTRFVPVRETEKMAGAMLVGVLVGTLAGRLRRRR